MTTPLLLLATIALLFAASLAHPTHARCPGDYQLSTGVQRDGSFSCWSPPAAQCAQERPGLAADECYSRYPPPVHVESRVYCTGGSEPVVVDGEAVGCQRGGWEQ